MQEPLEISRVARARRSLTNGQKQEDRMEQSAVSNERRQEDGLDVIDLTTNPNIPVSDSIPMMKPEFIFRNAKPRSAPLLRVVRIFYTHEGQSLAQKLGADALAALTEIFRNAKKVKMFGVVYDYETGQKLPSPVSYSAEEVRARIQMNLNSLLDQMNYRHQTYRAWIDEDRLKDVEVSFTRPIRVKFYATTHEAIVFSDLMTLFDANCRLLHVAEVCGEISQGERSIEISEMSQEINRLVKYMKTMSHGMRFAKIRKSAKAREKEEAKKRRREERKKESRESEKGVVASEDTENVMKKGEVSSGRRGVRRKRGGNKS